VTILGHERPRLEKFVTGIDAPGEVTSNSVFVPMSSHCFA
jgi:hypothetical protein